MGFQCPILSKKKKKNVSDNQKFVSVFRRKKTSFEADRMETETEITGIKFSECFWKIKKYFI